AADDVVLTVQDTHLPAGFVARGSVAGRGVGQNTASFTPPGDRPGPRERWARDGASSWRWAERPCGNRSSRVGKAHPQRGDFPVAGHRENARRWWPRVKPDGRNMSDPTNEYS